MAASPVGIANVLALKVTGAVPLDVRPPSYLSMIPENQTFWTDFFLATSKRRKNSTLIGILTLPI